jgi:hypothetical protein
MQDSVETGPAANDDWILAIQQSSGDAMQRLPWPIHVTAEGVLRSGGYPGVHTVLVGFKADPNRRRMDVTFAEWLAEGKLDSIIGMCPVFTQGTGNHLPMYAVPVPVNSVCRRSDPLNAA